MMLKSTAEFRYEEIKHERGIYLQGDIVEVILRSGVIKPASYNKKGEPLYSYHDVMQKISKLSLESIHSLIDSFAFE